MEIILSYSILINQILLVVALVLFAGTAIVFRSKRFEKYSLIDRLKISLVPLPSGYETILPEDRPELKWHRRISLSILGILILRALIAYAALL